MMATIRVASITVLVLRIEEQLLLHLLENIINCESGNTGVYANSQYHTEDPLWDGTGCLVNNNCCINTDQPWFFRQLTMQRKHDIEARLCTNQVFADEAVLVEQIKLYVK